jgi:hypothetical protein
MPKKEDLVGQKFGKLTVTSKAPSILSGKKVKRYWGAWNCQCECGKIKVVKTINLKRGSTKSCGCIVLNGSTQLLPGQKFHRLTTISYSQNKWFCLCECGQSIQVSSYNLVSNNTKSCGCLKIEVATKNSHRLIAGRRQFEPRIASARRVWKNYCYRDKKMTLTFEEFLAISQQNCNYCGTPPNTRYNHFSTPSSRSCSSTEQKGLFVYNGIDRIDSLQAHIPNNVITCCVLCNRAKSNRSLLNFLSWVKRLKISHFQPINLNAIQIPFPTNGSLQTSIKCVFSNYQYNTDLKIEEYYSISQMNCFYCGSPPNNNFNRAKTDKKASQLAKKNGNYRYNGLDRIDSSLSHISNNVVPSCKWCNFAKNKLSLTDFQQWIDRITQFQKEKTALKINTLKL